MIRFDNTYVRLPAVLHAPVTPTPVRAPRLIRLNHELATELGLDADEWASSAGAAVLGGNRLPPGAEPLAMAYAGHQFGQFVPSLGDGRAVLLGELVDVAGQRRDLHLKGAGRTPFSRGGDGRAALGPVVREYVLGEAMAGLGIPTTRALAMVATGEAVYRDRPEPGAVLARVAAGHVRVGTFQYVANLGDLDAVRALADYVIDRHYPDCAAAGQRYRALFEAVAQAQAALIARWMLVGFIHGVMNTDNMAISGETIDYGPCAFMDRYHPATKFSSIDHGGRYAYDRQPGIGYWNLAQLANCLLPLLADDEADGEAARQWALGALDRYGEAVDAAYVDGLCAKIGLQRPRAGDRELALDLLARMAEQGADFTNTFRLLSDLSAEASERDAPLRALFDQPAVLDDWVGRWRRRLAQEERPDAARQAAMRLVNPAFIPRNHLVQRVIEAATGETMDLGPLDALLRVVARPYDEDAGSAEYRRPPRPEEEVQRTFCGT
ncbi:YdiU family protein [Thiohalocapsa marina]|uniref:Protein nucleotidyltransferase YdiU n=1 Tax=Thiohalocapsa marina TaxID=424902 RepID=A0A5M8FHE0_9GAMM|nr:YdiU family protein [Thiohalocapsa marina]KAA6184303.1 YdiU family protein [Thiohalocapsa marina]